MSSKPAVPANLRTAVELLVCNLLKDCGYKSEQIDTLMERHQPLAVYAYNLSTLRAHGACGCCADYIKAMKDAAHMVLSNNPPAAKPFGWSPMDAIDQITNRIGPVTARQPLQEVTVGDPEPEAA